MGIDAVFIASDDRELGRRLLVLLADYDVPAEVTSEGAAVQVLLHDPRRATIRCGGTSTRLRRWTVEDVVHAIDVASGRVLPDVAHHELGRLRMVGPSSELHLDGTPILLTRTERRLLRHLLRNPTAVHCRQRIVDHVWPLDYRGQLGVVDTFVSYLRRKLGDDWRLVIRTAYGEGYSLHAP